MARDQALEAAVAADLADLTGLATRAMFGGLATLWRGNLICAASDRGLLLRLGPGADDLAPGVEPMVMQGRAMPGWFIAPPALAADLDARRALLERVRAFATTLPAK